jgi:hypothetical protein
MCTRLTPRRYRTGERSAVPRASEEPSCVVDQRVHESGPILRGEEAPQEGFGLHQIAFGALVAERLGGDGRIMPDEDGHAADPP